MKNFVQYIDSTYAVKVKELQLVAPDSLLENYVLSGINDDFFPVSVFIKNKRVDGVSLANVDSLFGESVLNDLGDLDLNIIPKNHFFAPLQQLILAVQKPISSVVSVGSNSDYLGSLQSSKVSNYPKSDKYGIVRPVITTKENFELYYGFPFPNDLNVKRLSVSYDASIQMFSKSVVHNLLYDPLNPDSQFNSSTYYHEQMTTSSSNYVFHIDDIFVNIAEFPLAESFAFEVVVYPNYNFVCLSNVNGWKVFDVIDNYWGDTNTYISFSRLSDNSRGLTMHVDWKKPPVIDVRPLDVNILNPTNLVCHCDCECSGGGSSSSLFVIQFSGEGEGNINIDYHPSTPVASYVLNLSRDGIDFQNIAVIDGSRVNFDVFVQSYVQYIRLFDLTNNCYSNILELASNVVGGSGVNDYWYMGQWNEDDTIHNPNVNSWVDYIDFQDVQQRFIVGGLENGCQLLQAKSIVAHNGCHICDPLNP
ncbi:hypothetical protein [Flavobacterium sp. M31R6]|uniref:hypothetical protein n=1 Tax=Flavobacterium sp. M31R6 TaxID=2739062 RepID=UPI0015690955|nr:hypothetical protein [Flavobacterium sp. M31R6]QKJ63835.1 hypothetical protein HQN62_12075 [Flavobacterium sp. M31R6]